MTSKNEFGMGSDIKQDLADLLTGATFFGSGGGGPRIMGEKVSKIVENDMPNFAMPAEMDDNEWALIAAGVGSPAAADDFKPEVVTDAIEAIEQAKGIEISHILAAEIGAGNSFMPIAAGYYLNKTVLNAAVASRAVPKITMSTFADNDIPVDHLALSSGNAVMTMKTTTADKAMGPMRGMVSVEPFNQVAAIALWPVQGRIVKDLAIAGTLSKAAELGAAIRKAPEDGKVAAAIAQTGGTVLAQGVASITTSTSGGFDHSLIKIQGQGDEVITLVSVNENLLAYSSTQGALAVAPDLISYMRPTGETITNVELQDGEEVIVIGSHAGPKMVTEGMISAFRDVLSDPIAYYGAVPVLST